MANAVYPAWKGHVGSHGIGGTAAISGTLSVALVTSGYTYSAAHDFLNDLGANVVDTAELTSAAFTDNVLDGDDVEFADLTGSAVAAAVIFLDTGVTSTSRLIAYLDTGIGGLPFTPSGATVTLIWDNGSNKIFAL